MRSFCLLFSVACVVSSAFAMPFSWTRVGSLSEPVISVHSDYIEGNVLLAVTVSGQLLKSTDSGKTWSSISVSSGHLIRNLWLDIAEDHSWYAVTERDGQYALFYTSDSGDNWEFRSSNANRIRYLSAAPLASGYLLAAFETDDPAMLSLQKSENRGADWSSVLSSEDPGVPPVWHTASVWQANWGKYASYDYGETWQLLSAKTVSDCGYDVPPSLFASTEDGLFRSRDNLLTWWPLLKQPLSFITTNPRNPNQLLCGRKEDTVQSAIFFSWDGGDSFSEWMTGLPAGRVDICFASDWQFFAVINGWVYQYDETPADIDESQRIDGADLIILATAFGSSEGELNFHARADLNSDKIIDGADLVILSTVFGHRFFYDDRKYPGDFPGDKH